VVLEAVVRLAAWFLGIILTVTLQPLLADGRSQIDGKIWNPYGSLPCDSCSVILEASGARIDSTNADSTGAFHFKNVRPGTYIIRISLEGFQEVEFRVDMTPWGMSAPATILLQPETVVRKKPEPAVVDVATISGKFPKKAIELYNKSEKEREKGNKSIAISDLEECVRTAPDFFQAHEQLGKLYMAEGRLDEAEREFLEAKRLNESSADPLIQLSGLYVDRNQPELAVRAGEEAVKKDSRSAAAFFNLGLAFYKLSRLDNAEDVLKKALALAPSAGQIRLLLANVYLKRNDFTNLRAQLDSYLAENPNGSERADVERMRAQLPKQN
jgi:hypothetical protein